jgi:hypothetical protein
MTAQLIIIFIGKFLILHFFISLAILASMAGSVLTGLIATLASVSLDMLEW